ncbi:MAG: TIGR03663 family protein [Kiritimatiellae bacterium]|nr:TIGR03663 family protein [Kiritimatiellia bacterium]
MNVAQRDSLPRLLVPLAIALAVALAFRIPHLSSRPMHGDEANQAVRTGELMERGVYRYDPHDHHGPVLYYAALPFCRLQTERFSETTESAYRAVPVVFAGITLLLMALIPLFLPETGGASFFAMLLFAVSPAFCYYNRFFIQESLLVCFLTGMVVSALAWLRCEGRRRRGATAVSFGLFAGLAMATKETFVLSFAAGGLAVFAAWLAVPKAEPRGRVRGLLPSLVAAAVAAAFVFVLFYSSFFTYVQGVRDALFSTIGTYFHRATAASVHQHPWWFYFQTVFGFKYGRGPLFSEALLVLLALPALFRAFSRKTPDRTMTFLAVYTLALTAVYSVIPYKTPWCALSFLHGWILLAGFGVATLFQLCGGHAAKFLFQGFLLLLFWHGRQAYTACFRYPADPRNPYVYAHTGSDCLNLVAAVRERAAELHGNPAATRIAVVAPPSDTWPLPWYLRQFPETGYWTDAADIPAAFAPELIISAKDQGEIVSERFGQGKEASFYGIRPGVLVYLFLPSKEIK